jgi:glutathione S-transferase
MALVIYGDLRSGACLKVKWTAERLGLAYDWVDVDVVAGETRRPPLRTLNPAAQVPTVLLEDGRALAQSNAILLHLGEGTILSPEDPYWRAKMWEWLFWEQSSHEPFVGARRNALVYHNTPEAELDPALKIKGEAALARMEGWLAASPYLVDQRLSLADIALLPYTRLAPEGGFDLDRFPAVQAWIVRAERELGLGYYEAAAA